VNFGRYREDMILFPYAKDIEYTDQELHFTIQLFDKTKTTDIEIVMPLDSNLSNLIEELIEQREEV
jgi:hypothetical protein